MRGARIHSFLFLLSSLSLALLLQKRVPAFHRRVQELCRNARLRINFAVTEPFFSLNRHTLRVRFCPFSRHFILQLAACGGDILSHTSLSPPIRRGAILGKSILSIRPFEPRKRRQSKRSHTRLQGTLNDGYAHALNSSCST